MVDESGYELKDYKFFCSNGEPKFCFIVCDREIPDEETNFYDMNFNLLPFVANGHPSSSKPLEKPRGFKHMIKLAAKLPHGIQYVCVDFYDINGYIFW